MPHFFPALPPSAHIKIEPLCAILNFGSSGGTDIPLS